jgi:hypothetical protein
LLVDCGDVQALTQGIDGILDEPTRYQTKALCARDEIIADMGCDRIAGLYHDVYSEVAENGRRMAPEDLKEKVLDANRRFHEELVFSGS